LLLSSEYQLAKNERSGRTSLRLLRRKEDLRGYGARFQLGTIRRKKEESPFRRCGLKSVFDDIITTVRYAAARWGVAAAPLTPSQRLEKAEPQLEELNAKIEESKTLTPQEQMKYHVLQAMAKKKIGSGNVRRFSEDGELLRED
jgi:hypothetical protein